MRVYLLCKTLNSSSSHILKLTDSCIRMIITVIDDADDNDDDGSKI